MRAERLRSWTPIGVYPRGGEYMVDWCDLGDAEFTDPFFGQTVQRALALPANQLFRLQTPLAALTDLREVSPGLAPTAFIFHLSRCGSTLVARMLQAVQCCLVLSEAEPIEGVLRLRLLHPDVDEERHVALLLGLVSALGQARRSEQRHLFIKFDAWQTLDLPFVRRAFPEVPWIFIYRDPVEILVSLERATSGRMGPVEARMLGLRPEDGPMSVEEFWARAMAAWCRTVLDNLGPEGRLVEYRELPAVVAPLLGGLCALEFTAEERTAMSQVAGFDAKRPTRPFVPDSESKQSEADDAIREPAERLVRPLIERLDAIRRAQRFQDLLPDFHSMNR